MTIVAYLSHPIGPTTDLVEISLHRDNLYVAHQWFKRLIVNTRWAVMAPWLAYLNAVGNDVYGPRALADQVTLLERCDILVQVGGWVSPHMVIESNHAARRTMPIIDLTDLGQNPRNEEFVAREIGKRSKDVDKAPKRRVWLPPLDEHDIDSLRAAQVVLGQDPFSEDAKNLVQRIVLAAMKKG